MSITFGLVIPTLSIRFSSFCPGVTRFFFLPVRKKNWSINVQSGTVKEFWIKEATTMFSSSRKQHLESVGLIRFYSIFLVICFSSLLKFGISEFSVWLTSVNSKDDCNRNFFLNSRAEGQKNIFTFQI